MMQGLRKLLQEKNFVLLKVKSKINKPLPLLLPKLSEETTLESKLPKGEIQILYFTF
jgi:hypothetical protein